MALQVLYHRRLHPPDITCWQEVPTPVVAWEVNSLRSGGRNLPPLSDEIGQQNLSAQAELRKIL